MCWFLYFTEGENCFIFFINVLFGNTTCLFASVSTLVLCEDGGDQIGCCKIILVSFKILS